MTKLSNNLFSKLMIVALITPLMTACNSTTNTRPSHKKDDSTAPLDREQRKNENIGKLFGAEALVFGGDTFKKNNDRSATTLRVNPFIWKSTLETIHFMPLASIDSNSGMILTDWYISAKNPNERVKLTIQVMDQDLSVSAIKVTAYKQKLQNGQWIVITDNDEQLSNELEKTILEHARNLKVKKAKI